jgi:hypothetical protein
MVKPVSIGLPGLEKALGLQQALFLRAVAAPATRQDWIQKEPSLWGQAQPSSIT